MYRNGTETNGKVVKIEDSMDSLLELIGKVYEDSGFKMLYTSSGSEITDIGIIRCSLL